MFARVSLWSPFILIPAGVITLVIGLVIFLVELSRKRRYTGAATAEILSVKRSVHHANGATRHVYTPTVAYTAYDTRYESRGQGVSRSDYYVEGAQIDIRYNVNNPRKCLTLPAKDIKRSACITMLVGLGVGLLGVVAMFT